MAPVVQHPVLVYQNWFMHLPLSHRKALAAGFWLCTTESTDDMVLTQDQALAKFDSYLSRQDFPLRLISRMIVVRAMTSYLLQNRLFWPQGMFGPLGEEAGNVLDFSGKLWEKTCSSWQRLLAHELSDAAFSAWTQEAV